MEQAGIENMGAYLYKMVIEGNVVKLEMNELRELASQGNT